MTPSNREEARTTSVLLITSPDRRWEQLHAELQTPQGVQLVGYRQRAAEAVPLARLLCPDVILLTSDPVDAPLAPLTRDLHIATPSSKIVLVGAMRLDAGTLATLSELPVSGYVMWEDLTAAIVSSWVNIMGAGNLVVGSRTIISELLRQVDRNCRDFYRTAEIPGAAAADSIGLRGTMWVESQDVAILMRTVFLLAGAELSLVSSWDDMLAAARLGQDNDLFIIDCSHALPTDVDRCLSMVRCTALPVYVLHPRGDFLDDLKPLARGDVMWLSPDMVGISLVEKLRLRQAGSALARPTYVELTSRDWAVWRMVASGETDQLIARDLNMSVSTVKRSVARIKHQANITSRQGLLACYRRPNGH